jgi:hypothetical protein
VADRVEQLVKNHHYLKYGSVDFEVLNSIERNDVIGFESDEDPEPNPFDDEVEL